MLLVNLYNLAQLVSLPFWLLPLFSKKRRSIALRRLKSPSVSPSSATIWVHALSVGEVQAARGLLKSLKTQMPYAKILLSVTTLSGFEFARKHLSPLVDAIFPSPIDLWPVVHNFIRRVNPRAYIVIETDIWPNLLWGLKKKKIPIFLVNGAISEKAYNRLKRLPALARLLYDPFDVLFMNSPDDTTRIKDLLLRKQIFYLGNIKFDLDLPEVSTVRRLFQEVGSFILRPVIVCGSTHKGEEELLLEAFRILGQGSLIICPRHPDRAREIKELAQQKGFLTALRSRPRPCEVLVVDTLGELRALYALAEVAFVGGTLVPVGGHNLLEPACLGVPVTFGPYCESIRNLAIEFIENRGGLKVEPDPQKIALAWANVIENRNPMSKAAEQIFFNHQGAAERIVRVISSYIS